ncbi:MAG: hypothetical protein EHM58_10325 [Ignavibacteriae bacterium]|nr:MAG: hypothetical protein EHM58_10325 [Ignavibacteriota bacterium]
MLNTLLKIGEWQSRGKSEWDRFLDKPMIRTTDNNRNEVTNYVLPIIFDLDEMKVVIETKNISKYDERLIEQLKLLKVQGGNNKAIYATVQASKLIQLYKTFFGKENEQVQEGEISEGVKKENKFSPSETFCNILAGIFSLKEKFINEINEININAIERKLKLNNNENIVLVYAAVKASKYGINEPKPIAENSDYLEFLKSKFLKTEKKSDDKDNSHKSQKLCYASGELSENVVEMNLTKRYSLNKMFVTETKNYASLFNKNNFPINYQVSKQNQEKLDYASNFILKDYKVKIANIDHVIIPHFREEENLDWEFALRGIKEQSDMLFSFETLENIVKDVKDETNNIFWINFIAYESDGNFFKSTEIIKDVSSFHYQKVIKTFREMHWELKAARYVDWNSVMTEYGTSGKFFNFNTVYTLIPIRKDKEKKNKALDLFKTILENRTIDKENLFVYFTELILCHYYERYKSYTNIPMSTKEYFSKSVRDSVFKYLAFIEILKKLNLFKMEETKPIIEETGDIYDQAILDFFNKMQLTQQQQAMFYLGRMLNVVEFIQKGKKRTVIQKVNFNGMDRDDIKKLRNALMEKAKQYSKVGKIIFSDRKFGESFDFNNWSLNPQEAIFFLLTGYSFYISKTKAMEIEKVEIEQSEESGIDETENQ